MHLHCGPNYLFGNFINIHITLRPPRLCG